MNETEAVKLALFIVTMLVVIGLSIRSRRRFEREYQRAEAEFAAARARLAGLRAEVEKAQADARAITDRNLAMIKARQVFRRRDRGEA